MTVVKKRIIQFPHPGPESPVSKRERNAGLRAWNDRPCHFRKFIETSGHYVECIQGEAKTGRLAFWGEWEAESKIRMLDRPVDKNESPQFAHSPVCSVRPGENRLQNTDPYVFGDRFLYSCCKQNKATGNPTVMQFLDAGSIVLFGSKLNNKFVLDTVLVVDENGNQCDYCRDDYEGLSVPNHFKQVTLDKIFNGNGGSVTQTNGASFRLYRGAMRQHGGYHGMFSFSPCKLAPDNQGFERISLDDPDLYINPKLGMGLREVLPDQEKNDDFLYSYWKRLAEFVLSKDFYLGVDFDEPVFHS